MFKYHSVSNRPDRGSFSQMVETDQLTTDHVEALVDVIIGLGPPDEDEDDGEGGGGGEQLTLEDELSELRVRVEHLETIIAGKHLKKK